MAKQIKPMQKKKTQNAPDEHVGEHALEERGQVTRRN